MGNISTSKTGKPCKKWFYFIPNFYYYRHSINLRLPVVSWMNLKNQCRHGDFINPNAPSCIVEDSNQNEKMEECEIERCREYYNKLLGFPFCPFCNSKLECG